MCSEFGPFDGSAVEEGLRSRDGVLTPVHFEGGGALAVGDRIQRRLVGARKMFEGIDDAIGAVFVFGLDLAEFGLQAGVGEVDGELAGGDVGHDGHERDEENYGCEADEEIGEDELVAQAPQHVLAHETPDERHRDADERDADEDLHDAEKGSDATGNPRPRKRTQNQTASQKTAPGRPVGRRFNHSEGVCDGAGLLGSCIACRLLRFSLPCQLQGITCCRKMGSGKQ